MPRLPLDIVLLLIDQCRHDPALLSLFSQVCMTWHIPSRKLLFQKISVEMFHHHRDPLLQFIHLLYTSPTQVGRYIKELHLIGRVDAADRSIDGPRSQPLQLASIKSLIVALPTLDALALSNVNLRIVEDTDTFGAQLPQTRPNLHKLELSGWQSSELTMTQIEALCLLFSSIDTLHLDLRFLSHDEGYAWKPNIHNNFNTKKLIVQNLTLQDVALSWAEPLYQFIRAVELPQDASLKSINIAPRGERLELASLGAFLRLASSTLQTLRVNLLGVNSETQRRQPDWSPLNIKSCTNLHFVVFSMDTTGWIPDAVKAGFALAFEVLKQARSLQLQKIVFHIRSPDQFHPTITVPDWEHMDDVLSRIPSLGSVIISFTADSSWQPRERFRERLEKINDKGLLDFRSNVKPLGWWQISI